MKLALGAALLFAAAMTSSPASAQNQRFCFQRGFMSGGLECTFLNMRQCLDSASGRGGICVQNPNWAPQPAKRRTRR